MTLLFEHTCETSTDEADVQQNVSGFGSPWATINKVGGAVVKYESLRAMHGTRSMRMSRTVGTDTAYARAVTPSAVSRLQARAYVWLDSLPTVQLNIFTFRQTAGFMGHIGITIAGATANRLGATNTSNAVTTASVASTNFPVSQWVRVEAAIQKGASGILEYAYYLGDSTTPVSIWSQASTSGTAGAWANMNTGTVDPIECRFGLNGNTTTPADIWWDDPALGDGSAGWLGPSSIVPPTLVINGSLKYLIDCRGSSVPEGTISYDISPTSGVEEIAEGVFLVTPPSSGVVTYTTIATGSSGGNDTETHDVYAVGSQGASPVRRFKKVAGVWE